MQINPSFFKQHGILVILIVIATWLRTTQLETHAIFFFDAGKELLHAATALQTGEIPLQGIASSRPWLHQGPVAVWLHMLIFLIAGPSTMAQSVFFALLGIAAVIALYETVTLQYSTRAATLAVALLAVSPLAVAHSRMPYHTTPIPLATVFFIWTITLLWKKQSIKRLLLAVGSWLLLFQFELSNAPLFIVFIYIFWQRRYKISKKIVVPVLGILAVGLLPQLLARSSTGQNQLWALIVWAVTQTLEKLQGLGAAVTALPATAQQLSTYIGRMILIDETLGPVLAIFFTCTAVLLIAYQWHTNRKELPAIVELSTIAFLVLCIAYFALGSVAEAYLPPFFIFLAIMWAHTLLSIPKKYSKWMVLVVAAYVLWTPFTIVRSNFFVANDSAFQYDSSGEERAIAQVLTTRAQGQSIQLRTNTVSLEKIPAYFAHTQWFLQEVGETTIGDAGKVYYVEPNTETIPTGTVLIQKFATKSLYWKPLAEQ